MTADPTGAPAKGAARRYALRARPGRVSSWLRKFAANPTSSAPESFREAARPTSGIPISLTTPVVRRLPRCARKPRSPPLQRSSASPIAATAATARSLRSPTSQPTRGSRSPRWLTAVGPQASKASSSCRPRCAKPAASRPVARWRSGSSSSEIRRPARTASTVIRTSQPNPAASGKHASRALGESERWPDSGSVGVKPDNARTSVRPARLAIPKPPPWRSAKATIARSPSAAPSFARSPSRSASTRRSRPAGASRSASVSACPLPRAGRLRTRAPARSASAAVPSREPSSATITSVPGKASCNDSTVRPMFDSSSRAATRTAAISATPGGRFERRQHSVCRTRLDTVVASLGAVQEQGQCEAADCLVDVVDARNTVALKRLDGRLARVGGLGADDRDGSGDQAGVEPGQEPRGPVVLLAGSPHDDDAVGRPFLAAGPLRHDLFGEAGPERGLPAGCELLGQALAERGQTRVAHVPCERGDACELVVDLRDVERELQGSDPHPPAPSGVAERLFETRLNVRVRRAEEDERDPLAVQTVRHQLGVRVGNERLCCALLRRQIVGMGSSIAEIAAKLGDALLEQSSLRLVDVAAVCDPAPDGDSNDKRREDRRKRRHVVAEVEHGSRPLPQSGTGHTAVSALCAAAICAGRPGTAR